MSYQLSYDADSRLIVSAVDCDCGCVHNSPEQYIYVGSGIVSNIARYIRKRNLGQRCVLVADNITWEVAGRRVHQLLTEGGFGVIDCIIRRDGPMDPDERAVDRDLLNLSMHCAKDYRTRYTLFKLLNECGLLEEYLKDYPLAWKP